MFKGLSDTEKSELEYEVINDRCRLNITRLFREKTKHPNEDISIILQNRIINIARQVEDLSICKLESDEDGHYYPAEKAWHFGELEYITKRQSTCELIETLCDLIDSEIIDNAEINELFNYEELGISINNNSGYISISIIDELDLDEDLQNEHTNIRTLIKRMDILLSNDDYSGVLHASASTFETLGKIVVNKDSIADETLGSFFNSYRNESKLPGPILDYILSVYRRRNKEPLAGHGSTKISNITKEEAIIIDEMTKAFVKIERKLSNSEAKRSY